MLLLVVPSRGRAQPAATGDASSTALSQTEGVRGVDSSAGLHLLLLPSLASLGRIERDSVQDALALLGLTIDPSPDSKVIGYVYVANQDVFSTARRCPISSGASCY